MMQAGCLDGIKVIDFGHVLSASFATMMLADMGAEVIKVERPGGESFRKTGPPFQKGLSAYFASVNKNKKCIVVDIKKAEGVEVIKRLAQDADIILENFRPGVMDRLGLGYDAIRSVNSKIIYASLSAFGEIGPYSRKPGFELIVQSLTGLVSLTTEPGCKPSKIQVQVVDLCSGLFLGMAILGALNHRQKTGKGQRVSTSLMESTVAMLAQLAQINLMDTPVPTGMRTRNPLMMPSQSFKTKDGYISVVAIPAHWSRFCRALGKDEWIDDEEMKAADYRVENYDRVEAQIEEITSLKTSQEWIEIFDSNDVAAAQINTVEELFEDPQFKALDMIEVLEHPVAGALKQLKAPWHMSETPGGTRMPPPILGQHTTEILQQAGFNDDKINQMKQLKIVSDE